MDLFWACHRIGAYFTPLNWHLQEDEIQYIVDDCDADALVVSPRFAEAAARVAQQLPEGAARGSSRRAPRPPDSRRSPMRSRRCPPTRRSPISARAGHALLVGHHRAGPKGVRRALPDGPPGGPAFGAASRAASWACSGSRATSAISCPAPLYHAAPLAWSTSNLMRNGASVVIMPRFDPELALQIIQDQRVTASQWVPTHFRRLLQLPESVRAQYDLSSLRFAVHAAAPCPIPVKRQMIEWWGDAICEYYGGTEGGGTVVQRARMARAPGHGRTPLGGRQGVDPRRAGQRDDTAERRGRDLLRDAAGHGAASRITRIAAKTAEHLSRRSLHDRRHRLPRRGRAICSSPTASRT